MRFSPHICLYAPNGQGLGHVVRSAGIARALRALSPTLRLSMITTSSLGALDHIEPTMVVHRIPKRGSLSEMPVSAKERSSDEVFQILLRLRPDVLVIDTLLRGSFHEFQRGFTGLAGSVCYVSRERQAATLSRLPDQALVEAVDHVIVPHLEEDNVSVLLPKSSSIPVTYVGPVTLYRADELLTRDESRAQLGLDSDRKYVIFVSSNPEESAVRNVALSIDAALRDPDPESPWLVVPTGAWPSKDSPSIVHVPLPFPVDRHLRAFDAVVGVAGYNAVYSTLAAGVPGAFFALRRGLDAQHVRLQRLVMRHGLVGMSADAIAPHAARDIIEALLRRQLVQSRVFHGAESAARVIVGMAGIC